MKIAPISGDLLVKLGIGAAVVGVGVYAVRKAWGALPTPAGFVGAIGDKVAAAADAINPLNHDNVFAQAADAAVTAAAGYEESAGGWFNDFVNGNLPRLKPGETANPYNEPTFDAMGNRTN